MPVPMLTAMPLAFSQVASEPPKVRSTRLNAQFS